MSSTLKMEYALSDDKTMTVKVPDPVDNLAKSTVEAAAASFIGNNVFKVGAAGATALTDAYIETVTRTELAED